MKKKKNYIFGQKYLLTKCKLGIAMIKGERHYWLTDGYTRYLVTDMNPTTQTVEVKVWS